VIARDAAGQPAGPLELRTLVVTPDGGRTTDGGDREIAQLTPSRPGEAVFQIPLQRFVVWVETRGFQRAELGPFDPETAPRELTCTLVPRPGVRGRVVADGRPVAGAEIELHSLTDAQQFVRRNGFATRLLPRPSDSATSAADGGFELDFDYAAEYAILCDAPGFATRELALGRLERAAGRAEVEVALDRGGAIEGRVLVPDGENPAGVIVAFDRHDGRARTLRADKAGRYRLERLTPGAWYVVRGAKELLADEDEQQFSFSPKGGFDFPVSCIVTAGETTVFDLDLRHGAPAELFAHVTCDGAPAVGWKLSVNIDDPRNVHADARRVAIDGRGEARLVLASAGRYKLELTSSAESGAELVFRDQIDVVAGPNAWTLAVEGGRVTGQIAPERAAKWRHELVWQLAECDVRIAITPDAEGRFTLPFVPVGTWLVLTSAKNSLGDGAAAPPVIVKVKRGEAAEIALD
jgi:hypothetical protein